MSRSLGPLSGLILGTANKLSAAEVCDVRRYFERLGFLMDILTSNHQITPAYAARPEHQRVAHFRMASPVFSQDEREAWMSLVFTERKPKVYIGRHVGVLGVNPEPQTDHESLKTAGVDGLRAASLKSQIVIGQLAVFVAMGSVAATPSDAFIQLGSEELPWPATRDVDCEDYLQLLGKPNLNWYWREALKTTASRRRLEHDFRKSQGRYSSAFIRLGLKTGLKRDRSGGG